MFESTRKNFRLKTIHRSQEEIDKLTRSMPRELVETVLGDFGIVTLRYPKNQVRRAVKLRELVLAQSL